MKQPRDNREREREKHHVRVIRLYFAAARSTPSYYKTLNKTLFVFADTMCKRRERVHKCASLPRTSFQKTSSSSSSSSRLFEKVRILRTFALRFERLLRRDESSKASTSRQLHETESRRFRNVKSSFTFHRFLKSTAFANLFAEDTEEYTRSSYSLVF